jgi:RNA polymerase sigma-70 factor (ECF subfamily)
MTASETDALVARVLAGETTAFSLLVREFSLPVRGYLLSRMHHRDDADDLAQEIFIAAFQNLHKFLPGQNFLSWLFGIAHNKLLHHFRSRQRRDSAVQRFQVFLWEEIGERVHAITESVKSERMELLLVCIEKLPEKMRHIVRAQLRDEKAAELAQQLGTSAGTIYTLHWRALKLLRTCMLERV